MICQFFCPKCSKSQKWNNWFVGFLCKNTILMASPIHLVCLVWDSVMFLISMSQTFPLKFWFKSKPHTETLPSLPYSYLPSVTLFKNLTELDQTWPILISNLTKLDQTWIPWELIILLVNYNPASSGHHQNFLSYTMYQQNNLPTKKFYPYNLPK